ncbi:MAG: HNH endonuclease, partial [Georgfuchsia sp.]
MTLALIKSRTQEYGDCHIWQQGTDAGGYPQAKLRGHKCKLVRRIVFGLRRPAKQRTGVLAGDKNPSWTGGRHIRSDGYVRVWTPRGQRLEHQVVMEEKIGRPLEEGEIVHHRDEHKSNNFPSNLELTSQSAHIH